ncbi:MAG TPA: rhodanese-like domain-containing protein [Stellaceae bacterium]|nr:rhodanese-like domain-containing protein [Stellaceae bacterium]
MLPHDLFPQRLEVGDRRLDPLLPPAGLRDDAGDGAAAAAVVDLASSLEYERGHIPGASFAIRSRLGTSLARLPRRALLVLISPDAVLARLAAAELEAPEFPAIRVLEGGARAWRNFGLPLAGGREAMADEPNDCRRRP